MDLLAVADQADDGGKTHSSHHDVEQVGGFRTVENDWPVPGFTDGLNCVPGALRLVNDNDLFGRHRPAAHVFVAEARQLLDEALHALLGRVASQAAADSITHKSLTQEVDESGIASQEGSVLRTILLVSCEGGGKTAERFACTRHAGDEYDDLPAGATRVGQ